MTLVAAFRCQRGGILLCADREENDGYQKREVDKIYRIRELKECEVFIAGAGPSGVIRNTWEEIHRTFGDTAGKKTDTFKDHRRLIESSLTSIHKRYREILESSSMGLIIVVAPRLPGSMPLLYTTEQSMLVPQESYAAWGTGKPVSDYLTGHLYQPGRLDKPGMGALGAFILQEAERSASGVGMGFDMIFIHEGDMSLHMLPPDAVKEIQAGLPPLSEAIWNYWKQHAKVPNFLTE